MFLNDRANKCDWTTDTAFIQDLCVVPPYTTGALSVFISQNDIAANSTCG
jgi:hypothetical protein